MLSVKSQTCFGTPEDNTNFPYTPVFGTATDTTPEFHKWTFWGINGMNTGFYSIKVPDGKQDMCLYAPNNSSGSPFIGDYAFSGCIKFKQDKDYNLSFKFVGLLPNGKNKISVALAPTKQNPLKGYFDSRNELKKLWTSNEILSGETEYSIDFSGDSLTDDSYALSFITGSANRQGEYYIYDIVIIEKSAVELELKAVNSPLSKCDMTNDTVSVAIINKGKLSPANYEVCYYKRDATAQFNDTVCHVFSDPIGKGEVKIVKFPQTNNFYTGTAMKFWLNVEDDEVLENNVINEFTLNQTEMLPMPFNCTFDNKNFVNNLSIVSMSEGNNPGWSISKKFNGEPAYIATNGYQSDDYLIMGCLPIQNNKTYKVSLQYRAEDSLKPEFLEVFASPTNTVNSFSQKIISINNFTNKKSRVVSGYFTANATMNKSFIAIKALSPKQSAGIYIDNILVEEVSPTTTPAFFDMESMKCQQQFSSFDKKFDNIGWSPVKIQYEEVINSEGAYKAISRMSDSNDSWLQSPPLALKANTPYELIYALKAESQNKSEIMNVFLTNFTNIEYVRTTEPIKSDTTNSAIYIIQKIKIKVEQTGIYYLSFQYKSPINSNAIYLDDIIIIDSVSNRDTNIIIPSVNVPELNCYTGSAETIEVHVKNLSPYTIPSNYLTTYCKINDITRERLVLENIPPYSNYVVKFINSNFSENKTYDINVWIKRKSGTHFKNDTTQVKSYTKIGYIQGVYFTSFENDDQTDGWLFHPTTPGNPNFDIFTDKSNAYQGNKYAFAPPTYTQEIMSSPCFRFYRDTTYLVSLYVKNIGNNDLTILAGSKASNLDDIIYHNSNVNDAEYQHIWFYHKPEYTKNYRLSFLSNYNWGMYIDDVYVADSSAAVKPELALLSADVQYGNTCDLSADSIKIKIINNGFFPYVNPIIVIGLSNGSALSDTINYTLQPNESYSYAMKKAWEYADWGKDSMRVWIDDVNDRLHSNDTSKVLYAKKYPISNIPVYESNEEIKAFNNVDKTLLNKIEVISGKNIAFVDIDSFADGVYAVFDKTKNEGKNGVYITPCINLEQDEVYRLAFDYRAFSTIFLEKYLVYVIKENYEIEEIVPATEFITINYKTQKIRYIPNSSGVYKFMFLCKNDNDQGGMYFDNFSVSVDTSYFPNDIKLDSLIAPVSDTFNLGSKVSFMVSNVSGRYSALNVPFQLHIDSVLYADTLAEIKLDTSIKFTFNKNFDFSQEKVYTIVLIANFSNDTVRTNDTLRAEIIHYHDAIMQQFDDISLSIYPNPVNDVLYIETPENIEEISIFDVSGKAVYMEYFGHNTGVNIRSISLPQNLVNGIYFVKMLVNNKIITHKIIKNNLTP
ncbi:hypothetical protein FACS1894153_0090 [Bacteroidia bacterium]|nr:hypothetical protein FACS1894153_0090 [Bacteroidia bacterium]